MLKMSLIEMTQAISLDDPIEQITFAVNKAETAEEALLILAGSYSFNKSIIDDLERTVINHEAKPPDIDFVRKIREINTAKDYLQACVYALTYFSLQEGAGAMINLFEFTEDKRVNALMKSLLLLRKKVEQENQPAPKPVIEKSKKTKPAAKPTAPPAEISAEILNNKDLYSITYTAVNLPMLKTDAIRMIDNNGKFLGYLSNELDEFQKAELTEEHELLLIPKKLSGILMWEIKRKTQQEGHNIVVAKEGKSRRIIFLAVDKHYTNGSKT